MNKTIKIYYEPQETGPAELLGGKLAKIIDPPVLTDEIWRGDIVKLTHLDNLNGFPRIAKVVSKQFDCVTRIDVMDVFEADMHMAIFQLLKCDFAVIIPPH